MKQHITSEQINELTESQKETLRTICKNTESVGQSCIPMLTIGQMIEILEHENIELIITYNGGVSDNWEVETDHSVLNEFELCDVLWDAIKEIK
ncbi:MAG: hypothetical protein SFH39_00295 [Candidatus Magnetobacterium sp. LHC-1]